MKVHKLKLLLIGMATITSLSSNAQSIEEQMTKTNPGCQTFFLNAMKVVPKQYETRSFDSIQKALEIWATYCNEKEIQIFRLLLDLQTDKFKMPADGSLFVQLLEEYSLHFQKVDTSKSQVNTNPALTFFQLCSLWAGNLKHEKKQSDLERFICSVLTYEVTNPRKEIRRNQKLYPELYASLSQQFKDVRKNQFRKSYGIIPGIWCPVGNLKVVGNHPFLGAQIGARSPHFQLDLSLHIRFLEARQLYYFKGLPDSTRTYSGAYLGAEFIYYPVVTMRTDLGVVTGFGGDLFDPEDFDSENSNGSLSFDCFNFNTGIRFNYYIMQSLYFGLEGRYHLLNYKNDFGTKISGNAFTWNFIIGFNRKHQYR